MAFSSGSATRAAARSIVLAAAIALAGCAISDEQLSRAFVDPAANRYSACPDLLVALKNATANKERLRVLIERAEQGVGGAVVSTLAYRGDYLSAVGLERQLTQYARERNCEMPPEGAPK